MPNVTPVSHIAQICSSRSWGGLEMHVSLLCDWQQQAGMNVELFCTPGSPLSIDAERRGIRQHAFSPAGYLDFAATIKLYHKLKSLNVQLVHAHFSKDLWVIAPAIRWRGQWPLIFSKHIGTQKPKKDLFHRWIYRSVDRLIAISRVIEQNLIATHPVQPGQVQVLYHGIDEQYFKGGGPERALIRQEWGVNDDDILIGTIGRIQEGKGHLEFLEMAAKIAAIRPKTCFVIVGEPTRGEEHLAEPIFKRAQQLNLGRRLIFAGFRKDVPSVFAAFDIFAFPSRAEAFGLVLIEAMAAGKAVVSTRCDGVLDIVNEGENGLMFSPMDVDDFTRQVNRLIDDDQLRFQLCNNAVKTVDEKFTRSKMLSNLQRLYQQVFDQKK